MNSHFYRLSLLLLSLFAVASPLLSTDEALNAWEVYEALEYLTHELAANPPMYVYRGSKE